MLSHQGEFFTFIAKGSPMLRLIALLFIMVPSWSLETVIQDQWYLGHIDNAPSISAHQLSLRTATGFQSHFQMTMVMQRSLGQMTASLRIDQQRTYQEDQNGRLTSFAFEEDQNGSRTRVEGRVVGNEVIANIARNGQVREQRLELPPGIVPLGQQGSRRKMASSDLQVGQAVTFQGLELISGRIQLATSRAVFHAQRADGDLQFSVTTDLIPIPAQVVIDADGNLVSMRQSLGPIHLAINPHDGPPEIAAADFNVIGLFTATGAAPQPLGRNRYRLAASALAILPVDLGFQTLTGDILTVTNIAKPLPLPNPEIYLQREEALETDDPAIRTWVSEVLSEQIGESVAAQAERLRLAVRSHITTKDLSVADGTASETFASRTGDCTEHANLLACALRIAGIPARVEVGVVYAPALSGWSGHAWVSAYDGEQGRWLHLDAAYPSISRNMYICTAIASDSDTSLSTQVLSLLGMLDSTIETLP